MSDLWGREVNGIIVKACKITTGHKGTETAKKLSVWGIKLDQTAPHPKKVVQDGGTRVYTAAWVVEKHEHEVAAGIQLVDRLMDSHSDGVTPIDYDV